MTLPKQVVVVIALVLAFAARASAATVAIAEVHAEPDVADEAGAVTLLVRTAFARAPITVVQLPSDVTIGAAAGHLAKLGAATGVMMELSREGTGLRVTLAIVTGATQEVSFVRVGDGDVRALAQAIVGKIAAATSLEAPAVPDAALGPLRAYAGALRQRATNPDEAALSLSDAVPATALVISAAPVLLAALPAKASTPALGVISARALRDIKRLDEIGKGTGAVPIAARAFAALGRGTIREAELALGGKPPRDGLVALAQLAIAESRSDNKQLADRLRDALTTDQPRAALAIASMVVPTRLAAPSHKLLVAYAEKFPAPGVSSRIGLAAAELGVEVPRALALISARELDDDDIKRLQPLIAAGKDATSARLRAEVSMRKADGTEPATVADFLRVAPDDLRAHRYAGWLLAGEGKFAEAAEEFAKAKAPREHARALLAANELEAALTAIGGNPATAEEHVIAMRVAVLHKRLDAATASIALAERTAPANPIVHQAILVLDAAKPDPARAAISRLVVAKGSISGQAQLQAATPVKTTSAIGIAPTGSAGSGSDVGSGSAAVSEMTVDTTVGIPPETLEPLVSALPGLQQLSHRTLVIAEIEWSAKPWSFRTTHPDRVRVALTKLLAAPPYRLQVVAAPERLPDETPKQPKLASLTEQADAVLVFRLAPSGDRAHLSLLFYQRNATEVVQVAHVIDAPGLVSFDSGKLKALLVFGGLVLLIAIAFVLRARGRVKIKLEAAPDVSHDALCVEISKSPTRPRVEDPGAFARDAIKTGAIYKARHGTLITSGQVFPVPTGKWYVHLYGAYSRAGQIRAVPSACTQEVALRRGQLVELTFDLASKLAEVHVEVVANPLRGVAVWPNDAQHDKVYTDQTGLAILQLPIGSHTVHIDAHGHRLEKPLQITATKLQRLSVNIEREKRIEAGIAIDLPAPTAEEALEIQAAPAVKLRAPGTQAKPAEAALASAKTAASIPMGGSAFTRAQTPRPGDKLLDRYRVTAELGRGAMGVVHRAWDEKLEREVAIKEMADELRTHPEAMRLFTQEAKALAQLNHTNIVAMYDQITDPSGVYMIMEFVDGQPLEAIVQQRGALPWLEAVALIDQVCAGLAYAHARKVIHRDIKPANIFIANDRTVKIGDFGLARVMREVTIRRTEIRGTPLYMAPEQITGTDVDFRTDLYAVGCTLFELLCSRPPFVDGDILYAHMHTQPPTPSSLTPGLPPALDDLLLSLLAKQSDDRPGSANEVRTALRGLYS